MVLSADRGALVRLLMSHLVDTAGSGVSSAIDLMYDAGGLGLREAGCLFFGTSVPTMVVCACKLWGPGFSSGSS